MSFAPFNAPKLNQNPFRGSAQVNGQGFQTRLEFPVPYIWSSDYFVYLSSFVKDKKLAFNIYVSRFILSI